MKVRAHIFALIFVIGLGAFVLPEIGSAQVKRDQKKSRQQVDQGNKSFRQKNYGEAIEKYTQAVIFDPDNATAHFWKGYAHYYLKQYDDALTEMDMAMKLGYKPTDIYKLRWYLNYEKKNYEAAITDVREALKDDPNSQMLLRASGDISYEMKSYPDALASYQKASLGAPNDADLLYSISRIHAAMGNWEGQASAAVEAINKRTQFLGDAYILAADAYQKQGKLQEAEVAYLKALESKPNSYDVYRVLSDIYRGQSRFDEAIEISRKAIRLFPNDGNLYTDVSWYYSLAGRHEDAIAAAQAGIRFLPNQHMAYTNLCRAYNDVSKPELAITACNGALKLKPDDGETNFYLARAYDSVDKTADATRHYKKAVTGMIASTAENPNYSDGWYLLGNAYFADSQPEKAIEAYNKCLELSPRFARARYNIGMVHLSKKNKPGATEQYNILVGIDRALATKLKVEIDKLPG